VTTRDHTVDGAEITPRPRTLPKPGPRMCASTCTCRKPSAATS